MSKVKPANGNYRLTPAAQYNKPPYDVVVDASGCRALSGGDPCPWNATHTEFRLLSESGWQFCWACFGDGTYTHFHINPSPPPGISPIIILDHGECEAV